jgi:hypothetical protein
MSAELHVRDMTAEQLIKELGATQLVIDGHGVAIRAAHEFIAEVAESQKRAEARLNTVKVRLLVLAEHTLQSIGKGATP